MVAYPVVIVTQQGRRPLYLQLRDTIELGRECDGLLVDDLQSSRRHVSLAPKHGGVVVEDLGSTNGTFLNGTRLSSPIELAPGALVRFGSTTIELAESA